MVTDHLLIRRAAAELDRALAGARVRDVGLTDEGRFAVAFAGKGGAGSLIVDPFATPPLFWLEPSTELTLRGEPGWTRAIGAVLRGLVVLSVRARRWDRVISLEFGGRSRFGVATASRLIFELVPRFGNIVLTKGETVVAAAKIFSPAENPTRSVELGRPYTPPPLPAGAPGLPRLLAGSELDPGSLEAVAAGIQPVHVYRKNGELVQAHLVPLHQYEGLEHETASHLLPLFGEAAKRATSDSRSDAERKRREGLERTLRRRLAALDAQLMQLRERRSEVDERDRLRRAGDAIYAHLGAISPGATTFRPPTDPALEIALDPDLDPKANAAQYFARYRKATDALPHLRRREAALQQERTAVEMLLWEVERADRQALKEIGADLQGSPAPRGARKPSAIELPSGARIYVGRSPRENVEITFALARPDDLWFHARNVPGAHVVLVAPPGAAPSDEDISRAASLAAGNSRARTSRSVDVDYTRRKHVRKQRGAAPGMVWYTDFKTLRVSPEP